MTDSVFAHYFGVLAVLHVGPATTKTRVQASSCETKSHLVVRHHLRLGGLSSEAVARPPPGCSLSSLSAASPAAAQTVAGRQPGAPSALWRLGIDSSQVLALAQVLLDSIGPRLTGSPSHKAGNDWLVSTYRQWGIGAKNEQYGTWRSWRRGITHLDLLSPRVRSLEATDARLERRHQGRRSRERSSSCPTSPTARPSRRGCRSVKGNFVLISYPQPTCRPDSSFKQFALPATCDSLQASREARAATHGRRGCSAPASQGRPRSTPRSPTRARGASSRRSGRRAGASTRSSARGRPKAPVLDVSCEDYGLLFRLAEQQPGSRCCGSRPSRRPWASSRCSTPSPSIRGTEKPDEYVMLSAHFDSWDGASGATDNGTGTDHHAGGHAHPEARVSRRRSAPSSSATGAARSRG